MVDEPNDTAGTTGTTDTGSASGANTRPTAADFLAAFPESAEAVQLVADVLKISLDVPAEGAVDLRHERIRRVIAGTSSASRTRAGVICRVLERVSTEVRGLILTIKDELNDPDIRAGDAVILPEGWLVVMMGGAEIGRVPFNPRRPNAEADASQLAEQMLAEYVSTHLQGAAEVDATIGDTLEATDTGPLATVRTSAGECVIAARTIVKRHETTADGADEPAAGGDRPLRVER